MNKHIWESRDKWTRCIPGQLLTFLDGFFAYWEMKIPEFRIISTPLKYLVKILNIILNIFIEKLLTPLERYIGNKINDVISPNENENRNKRIKELEIFFDKKYQDYGKKENETEGLEKLAYGMIKNLIVVMNRFILFWGKKVIFPLYYNNSSIEGLNEW